MERMADVLLFGSGVFAGRIALDIAAVAAAPVRVCIAGRNAARVDWLCLAGNARATLFGRPATFTAAAIDLATDDAAALIARLRPAVIVQAASLQQSSVISTRTNAWSRLVAEAGLSATAVFQAMLTLRTAQAIAAAGHAAPLVNACFPDVVNPMIVAAGYPLASGVGNVGILANAFAGAIGLRQPGRVKVLAHYQTLRDFRLPPQERRGPGPRVWIDGAEARENVIHFRAVRLTAEPAIEISGASGVPLILAMAQGGTWQGHVPGPNGLPGGYPVRLQDGVLALDLPDALGHDAAVRWNAAFEETNGLVVEPGGRVGYRGVLHDRLHALSPALAAGFHMTELDAAHAAMADLRSPTPGPSWKPWPQKPKACSSPGVPPGPRTGSMSGR
jgi:hypothetical protein